MAQKADKTSQFRDKVWPKSKLILGLYLLLIPTVISMVVFDYYPKFDVVVMSLFRWQPPSIQEYIGFKNYTDAFSDPIFWESFRLVLILLVTNLLKMWPCIFAAIALHRLISPKARYIYQVLFVIPMVIPGLVWLLIWKSFYDPDFGLMNRFLNASGLMHVLHALDGTKDAPGIMPQISAAMQPVFQHFVDPVFGNIWGVMLLGAFFFSMVNWPDHSPRRFQSYLWVVAMALLVPVSRGLGMMNSGLGVLLVLIAAVVLFVVLAKRIHGNWILYAFLFLGGTVALWHSPLRVALLFVVAVIVAEVVWKRAERFLARDILRVAGSVFLFGGALVFCLAQIWINPTGQFLEGSPAWLGNKDLVLPAIIFWGFPWVGTVGVLIYLSGLQQISQDVYEAAELDSVGPIGMLFRIELPLIMTQVRINLIFMTIGTLTAYEFFLLLLGSSGGPANKGMVPGLYMYAKAFEEGLFGYACALGMVLFVIVLLLTVIYNKYVKVEK
jgi:ABC-type sugar transport system permease subunit